ncbi:N-succinylarginine dihydrolase [Sessilibacter sp. MAH1]
MTSQVFEVNFDGLVGPTHNYAGLSRGNLASNNNAGLIASPKQAALQGLEKMKALADLGLMQAVLPPHERPHIPTLKKLGITGDTESDIIANTLNTAPYLLSAVSSASNMWVANAATVSPFPDTVDGKTHFTPANLSSMFHRSIEPETTARILKAIFRGDDYVHHNPLPAGSFFSDEGAANHTRFCREYAEVGVEFFVYGARAFDKSQPKPTQFPARQTKEACEAIVRQHNLCPHKYVIAQQNPAAIDAGVFHNDVIAVGNRNLLFYHEQAFLNTDDVLAQLNSALKRDALPDASGLQFIEVPSALISIHDAVNSYLFNTQLITPPGRKNHTIIAPAECKHMRNVADYLHWLVEDHPAIDEVIFLDLKQSMRNGGGPACLRLRVVMSCQQIEKCSANVFMDDGLYETLTGWVEKHYRDELAPADLADPELVYESRRALDELTQLLNLGSIYDFQLLPR